jgi:putative nucleotidyltransferase with HDIG domain
VNKPQPSYITPDQLCIGLYVHLDLGWMDHPFAFNNFKIKDAKQIEEIRALGLKQIRYDPLRSDCTPLPEAASAPAPSTGTGVVSPSPPVAGPALENTGQPDREERLKQLHGAIRDCEKAYAAAADSVREATANMLRQPEASKNKAEALVSGMVESILTEPEIVLHAINDIQPGKVAPYIHPLNVTVLALMLAKSLDMTAEDARQLGLAAVFHDIGKAEIPDRILLKTDPLTRAEQTLVEQHCEIGARLALQAGLSKQVASLILQHHEHADGSGYPKRLTGDQIDFLARLLVIVNTFDNLCNPVNPTAALTPYEALASMFSTQRKKFDPDLLKLFIKSLGVYPPGSIVLLSNDVYGIVISVNPNQPLRPYVLLHMPGAPREAPMVVDLRQEPTLNIRQCLRPEKLPQEVSDYLSPRKRISYYFNTDPSQSRE